MSAGKSNKAFTLAEVLITLGIIGIIAAMTLPALIGKWQKAETITRLKRTYTVLSLAIERSKADYGDVSGWGLDGIYGSSLGNKRVLIENFVSVYLVPYLAKVKDVKYTTIAEFGYVILSNIDGTEPNWAPRGAEGAMLVLNDGTVIYISIDTHNYGTSEHRDERLTNILFMADLNGIKKPNKVGRDIFLFQLSLGKNAKVDFYNYGVPYENVLRMCRAGGQESRQCGQLIMMDGWHIKNHYPW